MGKSHKFSPENGDSLSADINPVFSYTNTQDSAALGSLIGYEFISI